VRSASRENGSVLMRPPLARSAAVAAVAAVLATSATGCETTQDKAALQQAKSAHILRERAKREKANKKKKQAQKKAAKHGGKDDGGKGK
jgi:hypothetical protein